MFQKTNTKTTEQMHNSPDYYYYQENKTEMSHMSNIKLTEDKHVNNSSEYYYFYSKPERRVSTITNIKTKTQMNVNNSSDYYYYPEPETKMSQMTNIKTTQQIHVNISSDYYYYPDIESKMSTITNLKTTEQMHDDNYQDYKTGMKSSLFLEKNTVESAKEQTFLDARRRITRNKSRHIYIYARYPSTLRNRHVFYVRYHYGWRCKYLGHKHCKEHCINFFNKICREVGSCSEGSTTEKYTNFCEVKCNIRFYKPDFNMKLFKRTKITRRRRP